MRYYGTTAKQATTPVAAGAQATTSVIPANKTYYLGVNDLNGTVGPKTKMEFSSGGYNFFQGNFIRFSNEVPLTISSSRLYVGNGGKVTFMVADLASFDSCTGAYSYYPISSNTIDVYPTTPNPQPGAVTGNSAKRYRRRLFIESFRSNAGQSCADRSGRQWRHLIQE